MWVTHRHGDARRKAAREKIAPVWQRGDGHRTERYAAPMRNAKLIGGAAAAAALLVAAGVASAPRAWRRLRGGKAVDDTFAEEFEGAYQSDYVVPDDATFGDPEAPVDEEANASLREELREKVSNLDAQPEEPVAPVATLVEPDLIVEGVPGSDPATDAARARLRQKAADATESFRT